MNDQINSKFQAPNSKQYQRAKVQGSKRYDLADRTLEYATRVNRFVRGLPRNITNYENGKQLVRAAGSVGANYIEANEA